MKRVLATLLAFVVAIAVAEQSLSSAMRRRAQPTAQAAGNAAHGKVVYDEHCQECHGAAGKGDGPAAFLLAPRPRDFTLGRYKIRSTETGSVPTDADLLRSVQKGLYGSAMPAWETLLSESDIKDVVDYVKGMSPRFASETLQVVTLQARAVTSRESVMRGVGVYAKLQCGKCHGNDGRGTGAAATTFEDDWKLPLRAADLTEPWTFRGGPAAEDVYLRFRTGMSGTPMPSFKESASDAEMWDLANYVVSLARKPVWQMSAQEVAEFYAREDAAAKANPVKRGKYLVDTIGCALCHSPLDDQKRPLPGLEMAGGMLLRLEPFGDYPAGNLTSDKETGLGNWTDEQIRAVMTRGVLRDGTRLLPYPMDWPSFSTMKAEDMNAVIAYLRTIPPIANRVPPPTRTFLPVYLWGKFKMLILGGDPPMTFFSGNVGTAKVGGPQ